MEDSKDRVIDVLMDVVNLVPLDIGTLSREYINTTSNDGTTLPIEQFTFLLRRERLIMTRREDLVVQQSRYTSTSWVTYHPLDLPSDHPWGLSSFPVGLGHFHDLHGPGNVTKLQMKPLPSSFLGLRIS